MTRNTESWWRCSYDENGEVGEQAAWDGSSVWYTSVKKFLGLGQLWKKSEKSNPQEKEKMSN